VVDIIQLETLLLKAGGAVLGLIIFTWTYIIVMRLRGSK